MINVSTFDWGCTISGVERLPQTGFCQFIRLEKKREMTLIFFQRWCEPVLINLLSRFS